MILWSFFKTLVFLDLTEIMPRGNTSYVIHTFFLVLFAQNNALGSTMVQPRINWRSRHVHAWKWTKSWKWQRFMKLPQNQNYWTEFHYLNVILSARKFSLTCNLNLWQILFAKYWKSTVPLFLGHPVYACVSIYVCGEVYLLSLLNVFALNTLR